MIDIQKEREMKQLKHRIKKETQTGKITISNVLVQLLHKSCWLTLHTLFAKLEQKRHYSFLKLISESLTVMLLSILIFEKNEKNGDEPGKENFQA
jgi:hypothetical protein